MAREIDLLEKKLIQVFWVEHQLDNKVSQAW